MPASSATLLAFATSPTSARIFSATAWLGRLPHQVWGLTVCALMLALGIALLDDYGVTADTLDFQRPLGEATLRQLAGEDALNQVTPYVDRFYGAVVEAPLRLVERILRLEDSRAIFVSRNLLTHLFFLVAGFAGYLLAFRLFGSRWLALFALLLFLLHPRIYAHSFFNSKDVPFLGMFMICLWLAHRAFGKGKAGAFALCGVAAGLLTNLRIMGLAFVAIVCFVRLLDVISAGSRRERCRNVANGLLFVLVAGVTYYATMPYLWEDPVERFAEMISLLSAHPTDPLQLFQGELVRASALPPIYLPAWFGITTPALALFLGAVGVAALFWRGVAARVFPLATSSASVDEGPSPSNTRLRFKFLVLACFVLPVLAVVVLRPTLYDDWRHSYFLWAPFVLLATSGLHTLIECVRRLGSPSRIPVAVASGLAALGLVAIAVELVRLHPHQHLYFNVLANRPSAALPLHQRFPVEDSFGLTQGYAYLLEELDLEEPGRERDATINIRPRTKPRRTAPHLAWLGDPVPRHLELFSDAERQRFRFDPNVDPDFHVSRGGGGNSPAPPIAPFAPVLYERRLYGHPIVRVTTPDLARVDQATANTYRATFRTVTSGTPALGGAVDVYRSETAVTWVKEACPPGELNNTMNITVVPLDTTRFRTFTRRTNGVRVGAACLWQTTLPDYPVAKLHFHQIGRLVSDTYLEERRHLRTALADTPPVARSTFDVYLDDRTLIYLKTPCAKTDTEASFFVHIQPADARDLPNHRRRHGFDAQDFRWDSVNPQWRTALGDIFDGSCLATWGLPDYPIASIATGQYHAGEGDLWRVDFNWRKVVLPTLD